MSANSKNPLSVIFGAFIQAERKAMPNETVESLCEKGRLGISTSLYKMIESGHASLNINKILDLIKVFDQSRLLLDRLAKYIAGQNIVDNLMNNLDELPKTAVADLADFDAEYKNLYENIERYFDLEEGSKEQKEFVQNKAVEEIKSFLQNSKYPMEGAEKFEGQLIQQVKKVPSLSVEVLLKFIDSFAEINPQHFGHIAASWEEKNFQTFESVDGIFLNRKPIVDEKNLDTYTYPYLNEKDFLSIRYIFITEDTAAELEKKFLSLLNQSRIKKDLSPISKSAQKKISFKTVRNKPSSFNNLLRDPLDSKSVLEAFWVFTTKTNNKIAFVGVSHNDVNIVYNLPYQHSIERSKSFDNIWKSL